MKVSSDTRTCKVLRTLFMNKLSFGSTLLMGMQHVVAMFGATVMAPLLMGFDPNVSILMSGIGTLIFYVIVGGRVPSYLGSSFSFIGVVIATTAYAGSEFNSNIGIALGGIIFCGALYALVGLIVILVGTNWIDWLMPPIVTGSIVAIIGLNLAPIAIKGSSSISMLTIFYVAAVAVYGKGLLQRLSILVGLVLAYVSYLITSPIDFSVVTHAAWFGLPHFSTPTFQLNSMLLFAPLALILVAENLGHVKAVSALTGKNLDPYIGRAFLGDGIATMLSGSVGGTGVTTYAENIGVMAMTKIYSSVVFVVAGVIAVLLGFSPKFGALIQTIPAPILSGLAIVVFGLIAVTGIKILLEHKVDFNDNRNLIIAGVTLILGTGEGGIVTGTISAIVLNRLLNRKR